MKKKSLMLYSWCYDRIARKENIQLFTKNGILSYLGIDYWISDQNLEMQRAL